MNTPESEKTKEVADRLFGAFSWMNDSAGYKYWETVHRELLRASQDLQKREEESKIREIHELKKQIYTLQARLTFLES